MLRKLNESETDLIKQIDRAEHIVSSYRVKNGELFKYCHDPIAGVWDQNELTDIVQRTRALIRDDGISFGYFDEAKLVAVASLGSKTLTFPDNCLLMDIFYVSDGYRGRGIGKELFKAIRDEATRFGVSGIYISATPTAGTVDFYLSNGCRLAEPNQELLIKEPHDIHLRYDLRAADKNITNTVYGFVGAES